MKPKPAERKSKAVTIYDLAEAVGMSPGTVSRVMNNQARVKYATRLRILEGAQRVGYKPQAAVRRPEVAIITEPKHADRFAGYAATLTAHLSYCLTKRGMDILLPENPIEELPRCFIDGIVAISHEASTRKILEDVEKRIPTVYLDCFDATKDQYVVCSDHENSGYLAARHFFERGRKRLAFLSVDQLPARIRFDGYRRAMEEAKLPVDEDLVVFYEKDESMYLGLTQIVRRGADAIYVPGVSMEALEALHIMTYVLKVRVPEQIALIGGENDSISPFLIPPLTSIEESLGAMADAAVTMLYRLSNAETIEPRHQIVPVRLLKRVSGG